MPGEYWTRQQKLVRDYDAKAKSSLLKEDEAANKRGQFPQYFVGAYPNCFTIPEYGAPGTSVVMGQCPGTHWYHAHKHGSTSLHLFNGLAGVFIIEGKDYDDHLKNKWCKDTYKQDLVENILVFQQFKTLQNLERGKGGSGTPDSARAAGRDPEPRQLILIPFDYPPSMRGLTIQVTFFVLADGQVDRVLFSEDIPDRGYAKRLETVMRAYRFRPARSAAGQPVPGHTTVSVTF